MCRMELYDYDYNYVYDSHYVTTDSHGIPVCYAAMAPKHGTTTTPHKPLLEIRSDFEIFNVDESTLLFWVTTGVRLSWRWKQAEILGPGA